MIVIIAGVILMVAAVVGFFLWKIWDRLSGADLTFGLSPAGVGLFIIGRWHSDPIALSLGLILLLVSVYTAYRLYLSLDRGPPGGND